MLVVSRKRDEKIRINGDIEVVVVEIRGDKVRLGVHAPPDVRVDREEVWQKVVAAGGHWRWAHLFAGQDYLGPVKCATSRLAEAARKNHSAAHPSNWGVVTETEDRPHLTNPTVADSL